MRRRPPRSTPFPYTTLFRSDRFDITAVNFGKRGEKEISETVAADRAIFLKTVIEKIAQDLTFFSLGKRRKRAPYVSRRQNTVFIAKDARGATRVEHVDDSGNVERILF